MKTGLDLQALAVEIERQANSKRDYLANTKAMHVTAADSKAFVELANTGKFEIGKIARDQIAEHTGIPSKYADKMLAEAPELYANNVNTWFAKYPAVRLTRTLDAKNRAFLSDKFQTFDNYDFVGASLPVIRDRGLRVMSCEVTERHLYIKAVDEKLFRDVPVGHKMGDGTHTIFDTCAPAVILRNSEVGFAPWEILTGIYTRACTNMAMFPKGGMKRRHLGARHAMTNGMDAEELNSVMSDATKQQTLKALIMQSRDVIASAFDEQRFDQRLEQLKATAENKIPAEKIEGVLEVVKEKYTLNDDERGSIFKHLIEGGNLSQYGLHAAITRASADIADYDRATELELAGGKVVELNRSEWQALAA